MPKVKVPRKSTVVDMTAMCDVSFLLLTFFILTAKFKPEELIAVTIPTARSTTQFKGAITIMLSREGKAYISLEDGKTRYDMLTQMIDKFGNKYPELGKLTEEQKKFFSRLETWGGPVSALPRVLSMKAPELSKYQEGEFKVTGIPIDSANNELADWVQASRYATDGKIRIAIKSDQNTNIEPVKQVVKGLTSRDIHRFLLVTTLNGPVTKASEAE
jgi:biopolymer transport protein ExbD